MTSCILPIPNEKQIAVDGMCWAATLSPIITFCTGKSITQHQLCAAAGRRPTDGASTDDMARALRLTARIHTYHTKPLSPEATFKYLTSRRPIVLVLDVGQGCHCACLRGLIHDGDWQAVINEPNLASLHSLLVPFSRVRAAWREGLVIHGRSS